MEKKTSYVNALPVLFGFFVMGFCDVVGITSAHVKEDLLGAFFLAKFSSVKFFKINIVVAVAALVALIFVSDKMAVFAIFGIVGFTIANVFPIIFGMAIQSRPDKANEISGLMIRGIRRSSDPVLYGTHVRCRWFTGRSCYRNFD